MWEVKDTSDGIRGVNTVYTWTSGAGAADGTLFTVFLAMLNTTPCFANHCDWRIPNVKELQSIVNYGGASPASSVPGPTAVGFYWSSTAFTNPSDAWFVSFYVGLNEGLVSLDAKGDALHVRAVRGGR